jgi:hypothetical protein
VKVIAGVLVATTGLCMTLTPIILAKPASGIWLAMYLCGYALTIPSAWLFHEGLK